MRKLLIPIFLANLLLADCTPSQEKLANELWQESQSLFGIDDKYQKLEQASDICPLAKIEIEKTLLLVESQLKGELSIEKIDHLNDLLKDIRLRTNELYDAIKSTYSHKISELTTKLVNIEVKIQTNAKNLSKLDEYKNNNNPLKALGKGESLLIPIKFANGKDKVRNSKNIKFLVEKIKATLRENPNAQFTITGYASSLGKAKNNQSLSEQRANNTKSYIEKYISKGHIYSSGKGESTLICNNGYAVNIGNGEYQCTHGNENSASSRRIEVLRR